jgi:signal transduction histidine kinase
MTKQWEMAVKTERERSARDLHDNLGQVLGFISLQAQGIKQELINSGVNVALDQLDKLVDAAELANSDIREHILSVRRETDQEKDFISSLEQDVLHFEKQTGIELTLETPDGFAWDEIRLNTRLSILSIIRESLNNIRKHAAAEKAEIKISRAGELLKVQVTDDGNGFAPDASYAKAGCGLNIMRERAMEIGAHFSVSSEAGSGCSVDLEIPMEVAKTHESHVGR